MSGRRFEDIITTLTFTASPPPAFVDKFHEIWDMITVWNENMCNVFIALWVSCLDESMSKWTSCWTCPGWMFVPHKPWPFGNEYHSICCSMSGSMYYIEMVEGKDRPAGLGGTEHHELGKTVGLMLRMCKSIYSTGKVVVLDSSFCVLHGIIELKKKGVYAAALIKKRRYWPKGVDGDAIAANFADKDVGDVDALPGQLEGE
jgi:hypothetical protein